MAAVVRTFALNYSQRILQNLSLRKCYGIRHSSTAIHSSDQSEVKYPPVRPRWPPGQWSNMTEKDAWELHEESVELKSIPTSKLRLEKLSGSEPQMLVRSQPYALVPARTNYYKYITKTCIIEDNLPQIFAKMDVQHIISTVKPDLERNLMDLFAHVALNQDNYSDEKKRHAIIGTILNGLVSQLSLHNEHLLRSHIDEYCRVETFWRRAGYGQENDTPLEELHYRTIRLGTMFLEMMKYQFLHRANWQVRNELPIIPFVDEDHDLCRGESIDYIYVPQQMGDLMIEQRPMNVSGAWINDPCEFASFSIHCLGEKFKTKLYPDSVAEHMSCVALLTAFGSCVAQAHNQGFNWLLDQTYPLTTQSMVFDGSHVRLCAYQLNTMRLWVDDQANPAQNLAWITPPLELLHFDEEGGFMGLREETLGLIIKCLLMETSDRGIDLRPYLPEDPSPRFRKQYFNTKGEEVWEEEKIGRWDYPRVSSYFFSFK